MNNENHSVETKVINDYFSYASILLLPAIGSLPRAGVDTLGDVTRYK